MIDGGIISIHIIERLVPPLKGEDEVVPYACMSDIALNDAMRWGLIRIETIADGCEKCDSRFKKGGKAHISSKTPEAQAIIERIRKREASQF